MIRTLRFGILAFLVLLFTLSIVAAVAWHGAAYVRIAAADVAPQDAAVTGGALNCFAVLGLVAVAVLLGAAGVGRFGR